MIIAQLTDNQRILCVFDTDIYIEEDVTGVEISSEKHKEIITKSNSFGDWILKDNEFVYDPQPLPVVQEVTVTKATGEIPKTIL
jgi:hypothetical protein